MTVTEPSGALAGRTVLVTGASGGIGAATVRTLHRDGARVVMHYRSAGTQVEAIAEELGERVHLVQADLSEAHGPAELWANTQDAVEAVDVLVNNAGAWLPSPMLDTDETWEQGWNANLSLNLRAAADLSRSAARHFRGRGGGIIITVASRSAHRGDDAEHLSYGAAKGGLAALTKGIARGFAADGVLAYVISPGWVATELAAGSEVEAIAATLPLGEITPPEDVAEVITFLASGRAKHATGTTIDITGADYVR